MAVGSSVYLNVSGVRTEFIVVNKGRPTGTFYEDGTGGQLYDTSCDGIWLLMKNIYENRAWGNFVYYNNYGNSLVHQYLNSDFLAKFDSGIQNLIKQVKIPFYNGIMQPNPTGNWAYGENGLSTKVFLLAALELGIENYDYFGSVQCIGTRLQYFLDGASTTALERRRTVLNGSYGQWWLRDPFGPSKGDDKDRDFVLSIIEDGNLVSYMLNESYGVRPAVIIPNDSKMDAQHNIIA